MFHRHRVVVGVVAGLLWGAWVTLHLTHIGDAGGDGVVFTLEALRASATIITSAWAVSVIVTPLVQSAVVWRDVGRAEREPCACSKNIIPIRYSGDLRPGRGRRSARTDSMP